MFKVVMKAMYGVEYTVVKGAKDICLSTYEWLLENNSDKYFNDLLVWKVVVQDEAGVSLREELV